MCVGEAGSPEEEIQVQKGKKRKDARQPESTSGCSRGERKCCMRHRERLSQSRLEGQKRGPSSLVSGEPLRSLE